MAKSSLCYESGQLVKIEVPGAFYGPSHKKVLVLSVYPAEDFERHGYLADVYMDKIVQTRVKLNDIKKWITK